MSREDGQHCSCCGREIRQHTNAHPYFLGRRCELCSDAYGLVQGAEINAIELREIRLSEDLTEGIRLERYGREVITNVPHFALMHSADGFDWGLDAPRDRASDLSLNVAEWFLRHHGHRDTPLPALPGAPTRGSYFRIAGAMRTYLRETLIAPAPPKGTLITYDELIEAVRGWDLAQNLYREDLLDVWPNVHIDAAGAGELAS